MSLINDALKRAARQRAEDEAEVAPAAQTGRRRRIPRRGEPMSVQTLVLLAGGAVTLIVVSVVITGIIITGKIESNAPAAAKIQPVAPKPQPPPAVVVQVPLIPVASAPKPSPPPPTAAPVAEVSPTLAAARPAPDVTTAPSAPAAVVAAPPLAAAAQPPAADKARPAAAQQSRSEQAQSFVDRIRVTGARAAGPDSKALVDGHVYRVNDLLDRALGIRLVQVDSDHLTLMDSEGATYIKNF